MLAGILKRFLTDKIIHGTDCLFERKANVPTEDRTLAWFFSPMPLAAHERKRHVWLIRLQVQKIPAASAIDVFKSLGNCSAWRTMPDPITGTAQCVSVQRVALGREGLVTEPDVVLFERAAGEFTIVKIYVPPWKKPFERFNKRTERTIVYVTHDQSEAMSWRITSRYKQRPTPPPLVHGERQQEL